KLFDKALKRVNIFVPMDTKKVEGSKAKAVGINTIPLATKQAPIVDYKITRDAKMFDREDLEVLYRIVKEWFKSTKPVGDNIVLWGNLMTMFEPITGDKMWREQGRYLIKSWKLIDSCRVIKGHVRNRNRPEGCIAEETSVEETIEFFSEYHKSMETIGIPPDKHETNENEERKPLSAGKSSKVSAKLFQKAHLYVIQNTDELVSYIERHKQVLKTENPGKRIAFLENEHSKYFAKWFAKRLRELALSKENVSKTVRWI
ncbi:retrovirus-related pol polyprotein from transposon TNT 1-94, partial [Tanacetum coccineum]